MAELSNSEKAIQIVNETLVKEFELDPGALNETARMREDLGLDSLDAVDLIVALEKALSVEIPEEVARKMTTVGDIYGYIKEKTGTA